MPRDVDSIETLSHGRATSDRVMVAQDDIDDGFFETLGIAVIQGRVFRATDNLDHPRVAIIGRALADQLWPDGSALGRRFRWFPDGSTEEPWWTVVGIVDDVKNGCSASIQRSPWSTCRPPIKPFSKRMRACALPLS